MACGATGLQPIASKTAALTTWNPNIELSKAAVASKVQPRKAPALSRLQNSRGLWTPRT